MTSRNNRDSFELMATIVGFIIDARELVFWLLPVILSLITGFTLVVQPTPLQVPGTNFQLGSWYQFALLLSGALAYVHFLRRKWVSDQSQDDPLSDSFKEFLWHDLPRLKRPLLLIPIFFFFVIWLGISFSAISPNDPFDGIVLLIILFFSIIIIIGGSITAVDVTIKLDEWQNNSELISRWIKRIEYQLQKGGIVTTIDFEDSIGLNLTLIEDNAQVNWAIIMYFHKFEFDQNLLLSSLYYVKREEESSIQSIECYELSINNDNIDRRELS